MLKGASTNVINIRPRQNARVEQRIDFIVNDLREQQIVVDDVLSRLDVCLTNVMIAGWPPESLSSHAVAAQVRKSIEYARDALKDVSASLWLVSADAK